MITVRRHTVVRVGCVVHAYEDQYHLKMEIHASRDAWGANRAVALEMADRIAAREFRRYYHQKDGDMPAIGVFGR